MNNMLSYVVHKTEELCYLVLSHFIQPHCQLDNANMILLLPARKVLGPSFDFGNKEPRPDH